MNAICPLRNTEGMSGYPLIPSIPKGLDKEKVGSVIDSDD